MCFFSVNLIIAVSYKRRRKLGFLYSVPNMTHALYTFYMYTTWTVSVNLQTNSLEYCQILFLNSIYVAKWQLRK